MHTSNKKRERAYISITSAHTAYTNLKDSKRVKLTKDMAAPFSH